MSDTTLSTETGAADAPSLAATAGPVQLRERMVLLDVLRGFALLGMLQDNDRKAGGPLLSNLIDFLADGSFYTSFSFLFGLGFAIQLMRAEEAKRPFVLRYLWRTVILFLIGAAHFIFNRNHPILEVYALFAVVLLMVRRWRPRLILALAVAWLVFSISPRIPEGHVWTRIDPEQVETERLGLQWGTATRRANPPAWCQMLPGLTDTYRAEVCGRAGQVRALLTHDITTVNWWKGWSGLMFMFLLGLYAGRKRVLQDVAQRTRSLAWVACGGLVIGLAGNSLAVFDEFFTAKGIALPQVLDGWRVAETLGNIGLSLFYLSGVTLLFTHWRRATRALAPLAYVGRMGLTNYIMQAVILVSVLGYRGLDLISGLEGWQNQLLINAFFAVQVLYSWWWFQHFRIGPLEWVWRSLTWFRLQPMRLRTRAAA